MEAGASLNTHWQLFEAALRRVPSNIAIIDSEHHSFQDLNRQVSALLGRQDWSKLEGHSSVFITDSGDVGSVVALLACFKLNVVPLLVPRRLSALEIGELQKVVGPFATWDPTVQVMRVNSRVERNELPGDAALLLVTSGTTGIPKVVVHSAAALVSGLLATIAAQQEALGGGSASLSEEDSLSKGNVGLVYLTCMPISSIAGFTMLQRCLLTGETLVLPQEMDGPGLLREAVENCVNVIGATPFIARKLLRALAYQNEVPSIVSVGLGGSAVSADLVKDLEAALECVVIVGYGATEVGGAVVVSKPDDVLNARATSTGRFLRTTRGRLVERPDLILDGCDPPFELELASDSMMLGYLTGGGHIARDCFHDDQWWATGDLASVSSDGYVTITGRASDLIVRGGVNIDPSAAEKVIAECPSVVAVAVIGTPSRVPGEEDLRAFVAMEPGCILKSSELRRWCRDRLPSILMPRTFEQMNEMPRASDGSISRYRLRAAYLGSKELT